MSTVANSVLGLLLVPRPLFFYCFGNCVTIFQS